MGYGFHEERLRTRRRGRIALIGAKWAVMAGVLAITAYLAHVAGIHLAEARSGNLSDQVEDLTAQLATTRREKDQLARDLATATAQAEELRKRYESDVPTGAISDLLRAVRTRLAAGVKPERLASLIAVAENTRRCDEKPVSKRFLVRLGPQRTPSDTAAFAERQILVSALGAPGTDASGRAEGWFDTAKPVTVTFTRIGGSETTATGVLPLQHAVVIKDLEYRFVVTAGEGRSFATATADACAYP
jgi:outer membrane murein-binding lipoprotein Lpp